MPLTDRIHAFLAEHNTLTLATTDADGSLHACALFFAAGPDFTLYFLSDPKTLHARHMKDGDQVAATIEANNQDWRTIRGLQLQGFTEPCIEPDEEKVARDVYGARFPFISTVETLAGPLSSARYYKIVPGWIRLIDNSRGFGHKEEWRRAEARESWGVAGARL
jgi:hypothetical protein